MGAIDTLNATFATTDNTVRFEPGSGSLPRAVITTPTATAHLYLHGAHLSHFQQTNQPPLIFMSSKSFFEPGKPIRGGVPVIFPWFGPRNDTDKTQMHGLVRTLPWDVKEINRRADGVDVSLSLNSSDSTRQTFPHDFQATFTVSVGPALRMSLAVRNSSPDPFTFEEALHTYFAVSDVREIAVAGLRGHYYRDRNQSPEYVIDTGDTITFTRRTDRLYRDARTTCTIRDPGLNREIVIAKENSATTVVWNPAEMAPGEFADLGEGDWKTFVCVETANARHNGYTLASGQTHTMSAIINARPLS